MNFIKKLILNQQLTYQEHTEPLRYLSERMDLVAPQLLQSLPQWLTWVAGPSKPDGKFDKLPKGRDGSGRDWQKKSQWMSFAEAQETARSRGHAGIGIVLPAETPGAGYVVALDFDGVDLSATDTARLKEIWALHEALGRPYLEVSPSGKGLRMFVLSQTLLPQIGSAHALGGKDELFCGSPKWVTVTGFQLAGSEIPDATTEIKRVADAWGARSPSKRSQQAATPVASGITLSHLTRGWNGWPATKLRDGDGREEMMLAFAGHLRGTGLDQNAIEQRCLQANEQQYEDPLDESVVLDRARRYADKASLNAFPALDATSVRVDHAAGLAECAQVVDLLKPVSCSDVLTHPEPPPAFIWDGYIPRGVVTLLGAHGGTGKSTIALMLAVCGGLGRSLFGKDVRRTKTVFVSLEDGANVIRYRLGFICRVWDIDPKSLDGWLHIVDGTEYPELFAADGRGQGVMTATYARLSRMVEDVQAGLVIVDNASDAYGGDEIQRRQVRAFMRSLTQIARLTDGGVLLLAHVDKVTSRDSKKVSGEGYSGSTAWHNSARSRLFLARGDNDLLTLSHQKSNHGRMEESVKLKWSANDLPQLLCLDTALDDVSHTNFIETQSAVALLGLLAEFESRGQYCSTGITSRNNVFAVLKSEPAFIRLKLRQDDTRHIVNQCQRANWIEPVNYKSPDRKPRQRWGLTAEGRAQLADRAPTAPTASVRTSLHMTREGAPTAPSSVGGTGESAHTELPPLLARMTAESVFSTANSHTGAVSNSGTLAAVKGLR